MTLATVLSPAEQRLRELTTEFAGTWRHSLDLAVQIGSVLLEVRRDKGYGEFGPWVEANFELGGLRSAQNFMRLAQPEHASTLAQLEPGTSVDRAVKALRHNGHQRPASLPPAASRTVEPLLRFMPPNTPTATIVRSMLRVFFPDAATALDMTYGLGNFWTTPNTAHVEVAVSEHDFRRLPFPEDCFDGALFDPPHLADSGEDSPMRERFGTYTEAELPDTIMEGCKEAWRVASLGCIVKITNHVHGEHFIHERAWVLYALDQEPFD